ncbi:MAG TPA: type II secretion system protein [Chthoniobacteraceae bacterium]|nr:type II secretion system protein [Chthoniobacteraceae bacterium]
MSFPSRTKRRAFTLLEMLVAIGVLAVLVALLFGVAAGSRGVMDATRCLTNLRTVGAAMINYGSENNGIIHHVYAGSFTAGSALNDEAVLWPNLLRRTGYFTRDEVAALLCRAAPVNPDNVTASHYGFYMAGPYGTHVRDEFKSGVSYRLRMSQVPRPGACILFADSRDAAGHQFVRIYQRPLFEKGGVQIRHRGRAHLFFLDGHVERADPARLAELGVPGYYNAEGQPIPLPPTSNP